MEIWNHSSTRQAELPAPTIWMTSIARNRCPDVLRGPDLEDATDHNTVWKGVESGDAGPLEQLERATEATTALRSLAVLDDRQRKAVSIEFFDSLTHTELAEKRGEPLGTVKTWKRRRTAFPYATSRSR